MAHKSSIILRSLIGIVSALILTGCATTGSSSQDPYENWNRSMLRFNLALDKYTLRPVAVGYRAVVPQPVRTGVDNVFNNFSELNSIVNSGLQAKGKNMFKSATRLVINSTLGIFGLFDVASELGITANKEDFAQTFATWGIGSGPYIMLPFMGPTTVRGIVGILPNSLVTGVPSTLAGINTLDKSAASLLIYGINKRQAFLPVEDILKSSGLDPYIAIRENYLAYRQQLIHDGVIQPSKLTEEEQDFLFDDEDDEAIQ